MEKIRNLKEMLEKSGKLYGEKIAYKIKLEPGVYKKITHNQVRKMIDNLGTALIDMGLKGKRIAVIGENRYEWEIAYLATVCGTGIIVPLDKLLTKEELEELIKRAEVDAIFYSEKYEKIVEDIKESGKTNLKYLISMDLKESQGDKYSQLELISKGEELIQSGDTRFIDADIKNEEMSIMLFTSGTTSVSKVVALSHKNVTSNLMDLAEILPIDSTDRFLSFLPLHHVFECTVGFLFSLYVGAETDFCEGVRHIVENVNEYKITVLTSVPAVYENIYKNIKSNLVKLNKWEEIEINIEKSKDKTLEEKKRIFKEIHNILGGNLKIMLCGAAALDPIVGKGYLDLGFNLIQGYGLTEASPAVCIGTGETTKISSVGKAIPHVDIDIRNVNNEGIGEIWIKGPNIMLEYYNNPKATQEVLKDGWFNTGDLGNLDDDGYLYISGRKKNVIVLRNGKNIYPEELESLINKIDYVNESMIFGKEMSENKNDIKIFAKIIYNEEVLKNKYRINSNEEIYELINKDIKSINKCIPVYKTIKGSILSKIPLIKTTTNKVKRQEELKLIETNQI